MSCASCSGTVRDALQAVPGVAQAVVNVMTQKATGVCVIPPLDVHEMAPMLGAQPLLVNLLSPMFTPIFVAV